MITTFLEPSVVAFLEELDFAVTSQDLLTCQCVFPSRPSSNHVGLVWAYGFERQTDPQFVPLEWYPFGVEYKLVSCTLQLWGQTGFSSVTNGA